MEYRINQADILINTIENDSKSNRLNITEVMASLHKIIDEHEKTILKQIYTVENEQKKQAEGYKIPLKQELQNLNMQQATFEMLVSSKNQTKLLETKRGFDTYVNKTNETLKSLPMPTSTKYYLKGIDELQTLKEKIIQCANFVEFPLYCNPQLERVINNNPTKQKLDLSKRGLVDSDMAIVADVLQKSTVRKHFFRLAVFFE